MQTLAAATAEVGALLKALMAMPVLPYFYPRQKLALAKTEPLPWSVGVDSGDLGFFFFKKLPSSSFYSKSSILSHLPLITTFTLKQICFLYPRYLIASRVLNSFLLKVSSKDSTAGIDVCVVIFFLFFFLRPLQKVFL